MQLGLCTTVNRYRRCRHIRRRYASVSGTFNYRKAKGSFGGSTPFVYRPLLYTIQTVILILQEAKRLRLAG